MHNALSVVYFIHWSIGLLLLIPVYINLHACKTLMGSNTRKLVLLITCTVSVSVQLIKPKKSLASASRDQQTCFTSDCFYNHKNKEPRDFTRKTKK